MRPPAAAAFRVAEVAVDVVCASFFLQEKRTRIKRGITMR
jgi:hypothetical protein